MRIQKVLGDHYLYVYVHMYDYTLRHMYEYVEVYRLIYQPIQIRTIGRL